MQGLSKKVRCNGIDRSNLSFSFHAFIMETNQQFSAPPHYSIQIKIPNLDEFAESTKTNTPLSTPLLVINGIIININIDMGLNIALITTTTS